ncbi:deoxyribose-phosphate aldolase [Vallitalea okinawensis]|uniref:deoxyribose-phosphate aldolase n=1 Tax=Vallitalea okinawensis TaxID=2078660 RepID=UPI000CFC70DF|nr:deoxyribose-phosphate aldolase [Vallitalea okinawensis]
MSINDRIDHTILNADATKDEIIGYCEDAKKYSFASVVVNSVNVPIIAKELSDSDTNIVAVVGFPLGAMLTEVKAFEASQCVKYGAKEIDMVINIGALKDKDYKVVEEDIRVIVEASKPALVKVIIETSLLTDEEKVKACELSVSGGAAFVKTSSGFSTHGATVQDIRLMKDTVGNSAFVKASGGIRTYEDAMSMIDAGADRIGVGDGKLLVRE